MKKWIAFGVCAVMAVSMTACGSQKQTPSTTETSSVSQMQTSNPFVSCESIADAEKTAGFSLSLPEHAPDWATETTIRATQSGMIEVVYLGNDNELRIRKGTGTEDISGDYNTYETEEELSVGDMQVQVKGNAGKVSLATWNNGTHSFSISSSNGMAQEELNTLISSIG